MFMQMYTCTDMGALVLNSYPSRAGRMQAGHFVATAPARLAWPDVAVTRRDPWRANRAGRDDFGRAHS
jgi:hypothetical protein